MIMELKIPTVYCFPLHLKENKVLDQIYDPVRDLGVILVPFRWKSLPLRRFDIFDIHWPDAVVMGNSTPKALYKLVFFLGCVFFLKLRGTKIVYHVHNIGSHDSHFPTFERILWDYFLPKVDLFIHMNSSSHSKMIEKWPSTADSPHQTIFLPQYRASDVTNSATDQTIRSRYGLMADSKVFFCFGLLRPYKGVEELIKAFSELTLDRSIPSVELVIAGRPFDAEYGLNISKRCKDNPRITFIERFLLDDELGDLLFVCDTVVMAHKKINNSGVALMALSANRRLMAPAKGAMTELASIVGAEWVTLFDDLSSKDLSDHLNRQSRTSSKPDLALFNPALLAKQLVDAYKRLTLD